MLIERMSNPKTILETPHVMPSKSSQTGYVPFSAVQYLIKAQKVGAPSLEQSNLSDCDFKKNLEDIEGK